MMGNNQRKKLAAEAHNKALKQRKEIEAMPKKTRKPSSTVLALSAMASVGRSRL